MPHAQTGRIARGAALAIPDGALDEAVTRLVATFAPTRIYLFGSRARGDAGPDSDYDLLVVVRASSVPGFRRDQVAYRALRGIALPKDVMVWTEAEFGDRVGFPASLPATVAREGQVLYEPDVPSETGGRSGAL